MKKTQVYLSLGSNVGNRTGQISSAIAILSEKTICEVRQSSLFETEPVEVIDQPWFVNAVVSGWTELKPRCLLDTCKGIERQLGRKRSVERFGPRTIDIDILLFGNEIVGLDDLEIPHPRMHERMFVLVPLTEVAPDVKDPRTGEKYAEILERFDEERKVAKLKIREY